MKLKRIELKGFKSFPDRTVINFIDGITAIVGPNGCGKSNIVDAIHWVLGEQKTTTLRAKKMEDVIFSGTENKNSLNYAHVQLIFDDGKSIDEQYSGELCIERYLYRDGQSSYIVNSKEVRLKDLKNLLMDTSIGISGYSIIRQGDIENILSDSKFNRRIIFEEASGISALTYKKDESKRRLLKVNNNLIRVEDIYNEIKSRIGPLKEESEKAKRYLDLKEKTKKIELYFQYNDYNKYDSKAISLTEELNEQREKLESKTSKINKIKENVLHEKSKINDIEEKVSTLKQLREDKLQNRNTIFVERKVIEERLLLKKQIRANLEEESRGSFDIEKYNDISKNLERERLEAKADLDRSEEKLKSLESRIESESVKRAELKEKRNSIQSSIGKLFDERNELDYKIKNYSDKLEYIDNEFIDVKNNISKIEKDKGSAEQGIIKIKETLETKTTKLSDSSKELSDLSSKRDSIKERSENAKIKISEIKSHISTLEKEKSMLLQMKKDVFEEGEKYEPLNHKYDSFIDAIDVDVKYASALESVLGSSLYSVFSSVEQIKKEVEEHDRTYYLIREELVNKSSKIKGTIPACDVVKTKDDRVKNFLSSIFIVDNTLKAEKLQADLKKGQILVTLKGDVFYPNGIVKLLSKKDEHVGALYVESRIKEISKELKEKNKKLEKAISSFEKTEIEFRSILKKIESLSLEREELELGKKQEEISIRELEFSISSNERRIEEYSNKLESLSKEKDFFEKETEKSRKCILERDKIRLEHEKNLGKINSEIESFNNLELLSLKTDLSIEHTKNLNELSRIEVLIEDNKKNIDLLITRKNDNKNKKIQISEEIENLSENIDALNKQYSDLSLALKEEDEVIFSYSKDRKTSLIELSKLEEIIERENEEWLELKEALSKKEIDFTRNDERRSSISRDIWDKYSYSMLQVKSIVDSFEEVPKRREYKQNMMEMLSLEPVNIGAIKEYKKEKARYDFLGKQLSDIQKSQKDLKKTILKLEEQMKIDFLSTFEKIKTNYTDVFRSLFRGGKASIKLVDPEDPLGSDISIFASPPGKKLQHMDLLSGGEKSLCAIALLFAVLKIKPAPFYVLDEIEAALDDINIERFGNFLLGFSEDSQFIAITHRKGTMEFARALYGVSMEQKGITKIVSVKLGE